MYRARDAKLKREVAIKILPDEFSRDPDRVGRFQREAEVLASLSHPNIAAMPTARRYATDEEPRHIYRKLLRRTAAAGARRQLTSL